MLSSQPQLEYTGSGARYDIPDRPYKCNQCEKNFKDLGGMMQHQVRKNTCPIKHSFDCSMFRSLPTEWSTEDWHSVRDTRIDTNG